MKKENESICIHNNWSEFLERDNEMKGISFEYMHQSFYYKDVKQKVFLSTMYIGVVAME